MGSHYQKKEEKYMKKRVIAGLLAAVMCTGLMPGASVVRADEEPYTVGIFLRHAGV